MSGMSPEQQKMMWKIFIPFAAFVVLYNFVIAPLDKIFPNLGWYVMIVLIAFGIFVTYRIRENGGEIPILSSIYG